MKIAIVSGGTGGHIFPAISLAKRLQQNHEVVFIGSNKRMEAAIVPKYDIDFKGFDLENKKWTLIRNIKICKKYIKEQKFDLAIGFGNYISVSFLLACFLLKIKFIIHEQNIIPGSANRLLHRFSYKTITSFKESSKYLKGKKVMCLGNPREEMKYYSSLKNKKESILVVMGSLGSSSINKIFEKMLNTYKFNNAFTIVTGKNNSMKISSLNDVTLIPFINDLPNEATKFDLVITRAGATTLKELAAFQVPMIIIPSPYVKNNHQYYNALFYASNDAAILLEEKNLTENTLRYEIDKALKDKSKLINMKINLLKTIKRNALSDFEKVVEKIAEKH
ncbi:MAG: UDP-N-acetylglucosamine--N-acetylmuramyl-(pentapeptide) pyrophosphoryl-undecaprenol N-acetylglucosamine transferase [Erysipelotrichaceae bacterium]|nr:UDP-N-acetylglucosamine--N-acetylmuramyl-(pentapeptide) pyrophosphoryl-undecaprenol N-acetylglucosamine transferase [Erysipelotrichaceae bacterium]